MAAQHIAARAAKWFTHLRPWQFADRSSDDVYFVKGAFLMVEQS